MSIVNKDPHPWGNLASLTNASAARYLGLALLVLKVVHYISMPVLNETTDIIWETA